MKKSTVVLLGSMALAAAALVGCDEDQYQQDVKACTDRQGNIVDDRYCEAQPETANGQNPSMNDHLLRDILLYHWIFGGNYDRQRRYVGGGGYMPRSNSIVYVSPTRSTEGATIVNYGGASRAPSSVTTVRGGFGGSFSAAHGGDAGGGE